MRILSFDTATSACSAALWQDGRVGARRFAPMDRGQSEALMPMVLDVLTETGLGFDDIDLLAVTVGPGAFTGLRIGLAAARGMALAAGLPCLGVTTLEAVAAGIAEDERSTETVLVALESKRADVYAQFFDAALMPLESPRAAAPETLAGMPTAGPVVVAGDAAPRVIAAFAEAGVAATLSTAPGVPDAAIVARLAARRWSPGQTLAPLTPLYLKPPAVTLSRRPVRP